MRQFLITTFLLVETGRIMLYPEPHVEKPVIVYSWDISYGAKDGGRQACADVRMNLLNVGITATCLELD